ncbi:MAG: hypothetical protein LQ340_007015 [Diploschistes diacapsis]|nr:MAG: hypothetical protein LQ340_007015 [Diploschistes diacapsis]
MKLSLIVLGLASTLASHVSASSYLPFSVSPLSTHEPNGNPEGDVNYYHINFTVSSSNDASGESSAICTNSWSDNDWEQPQAYSVNVPTGSWIACSPSTYSFQLYPYFSIGNFTLGIQQNFTSSTTWARMLASGSTHITNSTSDFTCTIDPNTVQYVQHASGDCSIPSGEHAISVPVTTASAAPNPCSNAAVINTTFVVTAQTTPEQSILVTGSIPELGNWDPISAVQLSSSNNDGTIAAPTWQGSASLPAGSDFRYKYLMQNGDGSMAWECCENRQYAVPSPACGKVVAGNNPDTFRG